MSRTTRRSHMDYWSTKRRAEYASHYQDALYPRGTGNVCRDRAFNNYDRDWGSDCHEAFTGAPKGYDQWNTVGSSRKALAKRAASKVMRNRGHHSIRRDVWEMQGD